MSMYLLPIHHKYAAAIYDGTKRYEIRKRIPNLHVGDYVFLYETSPIQLVTGYFIVDYIFKGKPASLYKQLQKWCGIPWDKYYTYTQGKEIVYWLYCHNPRKFTTPITLMDLGINYCPQSWVKLRCSPDKNTDELLDSIFSRP